MAIVGVMGVIVSHLVFLLDAIIYVHFMFPAAILNTRYFLEIKQIPSDV